MILFDHPVSACRFRRRALQVACQRRGGFTLIEMMVVVLIIAILASMTAVAVNTAKEKARQTACMSNLRQLGTALVTYRADNSGRNPNWLSNLYPSYIDDKRVFVCRSDEARGLGRTRPAYLPGESGGQMYPETIDNESNNGRLGLGNRSANKDISANSYFYEFSAARSPWSVNGQAATWNEYKENQLAHGDQASVDADGKQIPYSSSRMPIVRCYHHARYGNIIGYRQAGDGSRSSTTYMSGITLNVAYAGNVIIAPLWWEGALEPGEH